LAKTGCAAAVLHIPGKAFIVEPTMFKFVSFIPSEFSPRSLLLVGLLLRARAR
jgi:hypothetical protein